MIYLDYAATTPVDGEVLDAMLPYLKSNFGNPDSVHGAGRAAARAVNEARARVADTLGVSPLEVYFTSGGTEADNWAVQRIGTGSAAVSAVERTVDRVTAAKAADEMLTLTGIHASFVLFPDGERIILSARSSGDTNVQVIVEALGGGGNAQVAGAQIAGKSLAQVTAELVDAINKYCDG